MNQEKIEAAERKACKLISKELNIDMTDIILSMRSNEEDYEEQLKCFKLLYNHPDADYRLALWNGLVFLKDFQETDFSESELCFLKKRKETGRTVFDPRRVNVNKNFATTHLLLHSVKDEKENALYYKHLKEDGDFTFFTGLKWSKTNASYYSLNRSLFFVITEKTSNQMVGYVGMVWASEENNASGVVKIEYYIFKPYRHRGYAKEAILALSQKALSGKLYELEESNYSNIYRKKKAKIELIRALIRKDNMPSICLIESSGFTHSGTLHRDFVVENKYCVDLEIYELDRNGVKYE